MRFDFIGAVESLQADLDTLMRAHLRLDDGAMARFQEKRKNLASHNVDRCQRQIAPSASERAALAPFLCSLLWADYECFGDHYGGCGPFARYNATRFSLTLKINRTA